MPWCPKCKNEFQEGYTHCSDCKVDLVEELTTEEEYVPFFQSEQKAVADKLLKYFNYSGLQSVIRYQEEYEVFVLYVPDGLMNQAKKLYQAFYFVERERHEQELQAQASQDVIEALDPKEYNLEEATDAEADSIAETNSNTEDIKDYINEDKELISSETEEDIGNTSRSFQSGRAIYSDTWNKEVERQEFKAEDADEEDEEETEDYAPQVGAYVMKEDQYKDYSSTVWIFLLMGIAGIVFVILNLIGTLSFLNGIFPNAVMGALFLFFIYVGISTHQKAKKIKIEIAGEKQLTEQINQWLSNHLTKDNLSSLQDDTLSEELNYIRMTEHLKEQLIKEFGNQNEAYLDQLIEDYYSAHIEE